MEESIEEEPIYLPPFTGKISDVKPIHLNLKSINLDKLSKLTLQQNEPLQYMELAHTSHISIITYCIIVLIIVTIGYLVYKNRELWLSKIRRKTKENNELQTIKEAFPTPPKRAQAI